jgi:hypothetical protein
MAIIDSRPTALTRTTTNKSFFLPVQSEFTIRRLPDVEFFCQKAVLPGVAMVSPRQYNPLVDIRHPGDVVNFSEFQVTFLADEYLKNYMSIVDWVIRLGFPERNEQYLELQDKPRWSGEGITSDCSIFFLDSRGKPRVEATFHDAFPTAISDLVVDSTSETTQFTTATASFVYTRYSMSLVT